MSAAYECRLRRETTDSNARILKEHEYDPLSGWCAHGCGVREDERVVRMRTGEVIYTGPRYQAGDLADIRKRCDAVVAARYPVLTR